MTSPELPPNLNQYLEELGDVDVGLLGLIAYFLC